MSFAWTLTNLCTRQLRACVRREAGGNATNLQNTAFAARFVQKLASRVLVLPKKTSMAGLLQQQSGVNVPSARRSAARDFVATSHTLYFLELLTDAHQPTNLLE